MPIYCEPLSDEKIIERLDESKSVLIIGCGSCANVSYNIYRGGTEPLASIMKKPLSILKEAERLKNLLIKKGFRSDAVVNPGLCVQNKKTAKLNNMVDQYDELLILGCKGGIDTFADSDKKVIAGMQLKGFKSVKFKRKGLNIYVDSAV